MSSPRQDTEEPTSSGLAVDNGHNGPSASSGEPVASEVLRPPAKRPISNAVIEISDTESDDSDVCAVTSYQASADEVKRIRGGKFRLFFTTVFLVGLRGNFKLCISFTIRILYQMFTHLHRNYCESY